MTSMPAETDEEMGTLDTIYSARTAWLCRMVVEEVGPVSQSPSRFRISQLWEVLIMVQLVIGGKSRSY